MTAPLRPCGVCRQPHPGGDCPRHPRKSMGRHRRSGARAYGAGWTMVRDAALLLTAYRCVYCRGAAGTGDHVLPRSRGGSTDLRNVVACCSRCNTSKGDRTLAEWIVSGCAPERTAQFKAERERAGLPV